MFLVSLISLRIRCQPGYLHLLLQAGAPRSSEDTFAQVEKQVHAACSGVAQTVRDMQTSTGVKDAYTQYWIDDLIGRSRQLQRAKPDRALSDIRAELLKWVDDNKEKIYNPFLLMKGFDVSADTPVEILHTILLGIVKYAWHISRTPWNNEKKMLYSQRLQSTDTLSLNVPAIRASYIMQYANSLVGRQLKTLVQVNAFHVYDLVDGLHFKLTKAVAELSALLWIVEIQNMDEYLVSIILLFIYLMVSSAKNWPY